MTTDSTHPFQMYQAIQSQPEAIRRTLERADAAADAVAERIAAASRVLLVGIGTSYHAARVGEQLFREAGCEAWAVHSFDFALAGPRLRDTDVVIAVSHRGTKQFTNRSLERAREAGAFTVLISGEGGAPEGVAEAILRTVAQERSSAHTVSYTTAIAALASLACAVGRRRGTGLEAEDAFLHGPLASAVEAALGLEETMGRLAREHSGHRRIWLAGGGPGAITAEEGALKIKETSYSQAEGMQVEALLHGPFCAVGREDLFVLIAQAGPARERMSELARLVDALGAPRVVVEEEGSESLGGVPMFLSSRHRGLFAGPVLGVFGQGESAGGRGRRRFEVRFRLRRLRASGRACRRGAWRTGRRSVAGRGRSGPGCVVCLRRVSGRNTRATWGLSTRRTRRGRTLV